MTTTTHSVQRRTPPTTAPANPACTLLLSEIGLALRQLAAPRSLPDEAVHAARKALKKARAALRLLRDGIDEAIYRRENSALRDAGRLLSPMREAHVSLSTFESLCAGHADVLCGSDLVATRKKLQAHRNAARRAMLDNGLQACVRMLRNCRDRARKADLSSCKSTAIASGLQRIYHNGRQALAEARECGTHEALHEWRKQVKYLANAISALGGSTQSDLTHLKKQLSHLADALGDDHDLAVLHSLIAHAAAADAKSAHRLLRLIGRQRAMLQKRAYRLAPAVYDSKPAEFMRALHTSQRPAAPAPKARRVHGAVK